MVRLCARVDGYPPDPPYEERNTPRGCTRSFQWVLKGLLKENLYEDVLNESLSVLRTAKQDS